MTFHDFSVADSFKIVFAAPKQKKARPMTSPGNTDREN